MPVRLISLLLCVALGLLAACDTSEPDSLPLSSGPYTGEWIGADATHTLVLTFDLPTATRLVGEARLFQRNGSVLGGAVLLPLSGRQSGSEVSFFVPIPTHWVLEFDGRMHRDGTLTGTLSGSLPPRTLEDEPERVDTGIAFRLDGEIVP